MRKKYLWTPCTAEMANLVNRSLFLDHKQRHNRNHFQPQEMLEYERQHQMTVNAVTKTTKTSARKKQHVTVTMWAYVASAPPAASVIFVLNHFSYNRNFNFHF